MGVIWYIFSFEKHHHDEDFLESLNEKVHNTDTFIISFNLDLD